MPPEVKVRLSVQGTPEVLAAFRSVQAQAQATGKASGRAFAPLAGALSGIKGLLAGAAAAFSAGALMSFGKATLDNIEKLGRLAEELGTTVEHMSGLSVAANLADSDVETLSGTMGKLTKSVDDLKNGSPVATAAFARLGLTAKDFPGEDTARWYETVATRLSKLADGGSKSAAAMALMGKNGRAALPIMKQIVDLGGLRGAEAKAQAMGVFVDATTLALVRQLGDSMKILKMEATGVAIEFVKGFGPSAVAALQSLMQAVNPGGTSAFRAMASAVGWCLRAVVGLSEMGFAVVNSKLEATKATLLALQAVSELITRGKFAQAGVVLDALKSIYAELDRNEQESIANAWRLMAAKPPDLPAVSDAGARDKVLPEDDAAARARAEAAAAARLAREKQASEDELKLTLDGYKAQEEAAKRLYDAGEMSLQDYFGKRREIVEKSLAAEVAALDKQWDLAGQEKDPAKRATEQDRISDAARTAGFGAETQLAAISSEESEAINKAAMEALEAQKKLYEARGEAHAARMLEIAEEALAERKRLTRAGYSTGDVEAGVENFRGRAEALADFEEQLRQADSTLKDLQDSANVTPQQIKNLRILAAALRENAVALGPDAVKNAKEFTAAVDRMGESVAFSQELSGTLKSTLGNWLGNSINEVRTLKEGFQSLALAIAQAIQQLIAMKIAESVINSIPGLNSGGKVTKKAEGGLIRGPGGPMSDSIVALLSNGEYVVREFAVRQPGVLAHLEALNRGAPLRAQAPIEDYATSVRRRFAEGGLVSRAPGHGGSQFGGSLTLNLPDGVAVQDAKAYLESPDGARTLIKIVSKNRRAFGAAQQR